jgi:pimeloyl-ACP methyl ester carboxylesterase
LQRPDRTALLASLRLPTLLLCGHDDSWSPLARHEDMKRLIAGSTLVAVPECGHMSTMERPEAVSAAMVDWGQS